MLLISDLTLWLLISFHFVAAATAFRRLFPEESPWLGFLLPGLALVMVLNFLEHIFPIPSLIWLLPFTLAGGIWSIFTPGYSWNGLRLPTLVFLLAFAFNFGIKCLHTDIPTNDGMADMNRILDYCFGETLPPTDSWLPPFDHRWYYTYQHYAASVIKRLFTLDIGSSYNVTFTLLNALVCFAGAGIAFLASGKRTWVALLIIPVLEAGFTGSDPWLIMTMKDPDFGYGVDIDAGWRNHDPGWIFHFFQNDPHQALVLEAPGDWIWYDQFHANISGFLMVFLGAFAALEVLDQRRCNWAWVLLVILVPLTMVSAAWYLILAALLCAGTLVLALVCGRRPENPRLVAAITLVALTLLWPAVTAFATWPDNQHLIWNHSDWRTPFWVFAIQWWPIYLPWFLLLFAWPWMNLALRWLHVYIGALYVLIELFNVGDWRWDTIEKMWGGLYGLGLVALLPALMARRNVIFRLASIFIVLCAFMTLYVRLDRAHNWVDWDNGAFHLDGNTYLREDAQKGRMLQVMKQLHKATILAGKCDWNYTPPPCLAVFTENRCYVAWFGSEQICGHRGEADYRTALNNQFYAGQMADPLGFLRQNEIDAVLIWPGDNVGDDVVAKLQQQLAPTYEYIDCTAGGAQKAGVFLLRPVVHPARE
jgi:hypothetical protein